MKKGFVILGILFFISTFVFAAKVSLKITNMSYQPQDTLLHFTVEMTNTVGVFGLQFDVVDTPDDFTYDPDSLNSYLTGMWQVGSSEPDEEKARVLVYNILGDSIASGTSNVVDLYFHLKADTPLSEEVKFKIVDVIASDATGNSYDEVEGDSTTIQVIVNLNDEISTIPEELSLSQNYPNPFNPSTTISFSVPEYQSVYLRIYNLNGELVRTLIDNNTLRGHYSVEWDGRDNMGKLVSSGMYIYSLKVGNREISKKMLLLR